MTLTEAQKAILRTVGSYPQLGHRIGEGPAYAVYARYRLKDEEFKEAIQGLVNDGYITDDWALTHKGVDACSSL